MRHVCATTRPGRCQHAAGNGSGSGAAVPVLLGVELDFGDSVGVRSQLWRVASLLGWVSASGMVLNVSGLPNTLE